MADISITASSVVAGTGSDAEFGSGIAGVAITAGQVVCIDDADGNKVKLADTNAATTALRTPVGVAVGGAAVGQRVVYQKAGDYTVGGTVAAGTPYFASATAGGIAPVADLASGHYTALVMMGRTTSVARINIVAPDIVR